MSHKWKITNSEDLNIYKYVEMQCEICGIWAFSDPLAYDNKEITRIYVYEKRNGFDLIDNFNLDPENYPCEEFIIKKIIE
jgi:hypothetical protein